MVSKRRFGIVHKEFHIECLLKIFGMILVNTPYGMKLNPSESFWDTYLFYTSYIQNFNTFINIKNSYGFLKFAPEGIKIIILLDLLLVHQVPTT